MKKLLSRFLGTNVPIEPRFDEAVARRLEAAGKVPEKLQAAPAEPVEIPPRPDLPGFTGMIRFELTLNEAGRAVAVVMDNAPFDSVAVLETWARGWSFIPARLEGKAHPCRMVYEVHWT